MAVADSLTLERPRELQQRKSRGQEGQHLPREQRDVSKHNQVRSQQGPADLETFP